MNIVNEIKNRTEYINELIRTYFPKEEGFQQVIMEAFNYSILAGGKRIRPMLMLETFRIFDVTGKEKEEWVVPFMAGMEMIHTYSLVHDDLPAMDNDQYRRGQLTTHAKFGEAMGILAGDALLNGAFEAIGSIFNKINQLADETEQIKWYRRAAKAYQLLSKNAGMYGMIGGQVVDVISSGQTLNEEKLQVIYDLKTGALLRAAFMVGAIMAGANEHELKVMETIAYNVGLAFQIQDDILDVTSTLEVLGKPIHSDEKNDKTTYVTLYGIDASTKKVKELSQEAIRLLQMLDKNSNFMIEIIKYLSVREK